MFGPHPGRGPAQLHGGRLRHVRLVPRGEREGRRPRRRSHHATPHDFDGKQSRDFIDYDALRYTQEPVDFERHVHAPAPEFVEGDEAEWEEGDGQFRGGVSIIMDEDDLDHLSFDALVNQEEAETYVDTTEFAREMLLLYVIERHTIAPEGEEIYIGWLDDAHLYIEAVVRHNMMMWSSTYIAAARVEPFIPPETITRALRDVSGPRVASISVDT